MKKNKQQRREDRKNKNKVKQMKWRANMKQNEYGTKFMMSKSNDPVSRIHTKALELIREQGDVPPIQVVDAACWQAILKNSMLKVPHHLFDMDVSNQFCNGKFFYSRIDRERNGGELTIIENDLFLSCNDIAACSERMAYPDEYHCQVGYDQNRHCVVIILMDRTEANTRFKIDLYFKPKDIEDYKAELESIVSGLKPFTSSDYSRIHPQLPEWKTLFDKLTQ